MAIHALLPVPHLDGDAQIPEDLQPLGPRIHSEDPAVRAVVQDKHGSPEGRYQLFVCDLRIRGAFPGKIEAEAVPVRKIVPQGIIDAR